MGTKKKWELKNYSEQQIIESINRACRSLAPKFKFTYYEVEDLTQEAAIKVFESLHKFDEDRGNLDGFIWTIIRNHLFNLKRNKYNRPDAPNESKRNVLSPISFDSVNNLDQERRMELEDKNALMAEYRIITNLIDDNIPIRLRSIWIKMKNHVEISTNEKSKVLEAIHKILDDNNISWGNEDGFEEG